MTGILRSSRPAAVALIALGLCLSAHGSHARAQLVDGEPRLVAEIPPRTASSALAALDVRRETLENGLRVVLSPDHTVPTVGIAVYYDVGSRNEVRGRSGFAHLFEHMMFQGSANVENDQHFALITERGGSANGTTSEDRTNYYETLPSNDLSLGLWLEADRMRSLAITQENFENQRVVVISERDQSYMNQPYAPSFLRINELAYGDYWPYSHSTIGDMADLVNAPLTAVQEFWLAYYPPNNAVLSISGDFEPEHAMELVREHFGDIARREVPAYTPDAISPQTAERVDAIADPLAELAGFHVCYHIPPNREPDHYPLELLAMVLGDGESSRLYRSLVHEDEILSELSVATDDRRGPDLFSFFALVTEGHTGEEARTRIYAEIERIAREGITERELTRVLNRVRSYWLVGLQSNIDRARTFAELELYYGDARLLLTELDLYLGITSADIQRVASTYFAPTNRTVLDIVPAPAPEGGGA